MDTQQCEVELEYGKTDRYFANVIINNVYSQLDSEGHQTLVMSDIVDHQRDGSAVTKDNGFTGKHSNIPKIKTNGWEFLIEWRDDTKKWVNIKDVKDAKPIELAEYAV